MLQGKFQGHQDLKILAGESAWPVFGGSYFAYNSHQASHQQLPCLRLRIQHPAALLPWAPYWEGMTNTPVPQPPHTVRGRVD